MRERNYGHGYKNWEVSRIFTKNVKTKGSEFKNCLMEALTRSLKLTRFQNQD